MSVASQTCRRSPRHRPGCRRCPVVHQVPCLMHRGELAGPLEAVPLPLPTAAAALLLLAPPPAAVSSLLAAAVAAPAPSMPLPPAGVASPQGGPGGYAPPAGRWPAAAAEGATPAALVAPALLSPLRVAAAAAAGRFRPGRGPSTGCPCLYVLARGRCPCNKPGEERCETEVVIAMLAGRQAGSQRGSQAGRAQGCQGPGHPPPPISHAALGAGLRSRAAATTPRAAAAAVAAIRV